MTTLKKITLTILVIVLSVTFVGCEAKNQPVENEFTDIDGRRYDCSVVNVIIKKEYSEFGKEYSPEDFDARLVESVEVMNQIKSEDESNLYNLDNWQQMLELKLKEPSEKNAKAVVKAAYKNNEVEEAWISQIIEFVTSADGGDLVPISP